MEFPRSFIRASADYADFDRPVPAPYLRRSFTLDQMPEHAEILVCGLGFYRLFVNGKEITKGILAPYISAVDDIVYYDRYELDGLLNRGENVIGLILGNGFQNPFGGYVWGFDKARWRGAPQAALSLKASCGDEVFFTLESDTAFKTHLSPILFDELRCGEYYDARLEIPGWCDAGFDDSGWAPAVPAPVPCGKPRLCTAEPIVTEEALRAVSITPYQDGWLYDFGINTAGRIRLHIHGESGQQIDTFHGEWYHDGVLEQKNINFGDRGDPRAVHVQRSRYICGGKDETYAPCFTYAGFQYVYVTGIRPDQAVPELLTYEVMHSDLKERGNFFCSDEDVNFLQRMTRRSTLANFFYFPTDCPHREKNGWTGDAALSAEHTLLNLQPEQSYREWLNNIRAAQTERGALPGIVPTTGWGYEWGCGPAWDAVLTYLPYYTWKYRGDEDIVRENADAILLYLNYLTTRRDERGLIAFGLGDWCSPTKNPPDRRPPLVLTDSIISMDIAKKAAVLFGAIGRPLQKEFAEKLAAELHDAIRTHLIDLETMTAVGCCQTSQAMAIWYSIFTDEEKPAAFAKLMEYIHLCDDHLDTGILGARVLFHLLSAFGEADLAYDMITRYDGPSYGSMIAAGSTSLWEAFYESGGESSSLNHHFYGDISSWFIQSIGGIVLNPDDEDCGRLDIRPHFIKKLRYADAFHIAPAGKITVHWERRAEKVLLALEVPEGLRGSILAPDGFRVSGEKQLPLASGRYVFEPEA